MPVIVFSAQGLDDGELTEMVDAVLTKSRTTLDELSARVAQLARQASVETNS